MDSILTKIEKAFERRQVLVRELCQSKTNAFRAFGGRPEGIEGLTLDVFDSALILNVYEGRFNHERESLEKIVGFAHSLYGTKTSDVKHFVIDRGKNLFNHSSSVALIEILENGLKFEIHPNEGLSVGLFLDQRENRKKISSEGEGRLLNLFSYTCGFGLYAAAQGFATVNVDVSKKYLEWGKRNFQMNGLSLTNHKFIKEDASLYLTRLLKRKERFEAIILDPPSFGRSEKGVFSVERDFKECLQKSLGILATGGRLLASSNFQKWEEKDLAKMAKDVASSLNTEIEFLALHRPTDFEREENPLSCILVRRLG